MSVLFVCTGNTCRSPMAQALYEHITGEKASSAGLGVSSPQPISDHALLALESKGITDFSHLSRQITVEDVKEADLILVMTHMHQNLLVSVCPEYADKIRLLGENRDIADPYGGSLQQYISCCDEIEHCIRRVLC
ncbi:MAG: low molecular weight protein arginine phosphatase [Ruminococcaceae bacterium]|nr:low molecular weight protein arginine phosphatase [Oscillospiraceae bacterium]